MRPAHRADAGGVQLSSDGRLGLAARVILEHAAEDRRFLGHHFKGARRDAIDQARDVPVAEGAGTAVPSAALGCTPLSGTSMRRLRPRVGMSAVAVEACKHKRHLSSEVFTDGLDPVARLHTLKDVLDEMGRGPTEAGVEAHILMLFENPGRRADAARGSGFISADNDDKSAENMWHLLREAGIDRRRDIVAWNIVPWYLGDERRIGAVRTSDIAAARPALLELLRLLPQLRVVILFGRKAQDGCGGAPARRSKWPSSKRPTRAVAG